MCCYCCCIVSSCYCILSVDTYDLYVISVNLDALYTVPMHVNGSGQRQDVTCENVKHATISLPTLHYTCPAIRS